MAFYGRFFKRPLDIAVSALLLLALSPVLLALTAAGAFKMGGNPFFTQKRPGLGNRIFRLIKFRTMDNRTDETGKLLPDGERLNSYGRFLRKTSLDELPELFNILKGDMSLVGPRPLLAKYLPLYSEEQRHRHDVRPGLTGLAQVRGRNAITWDERFRLDLEYVRSVSLENDLRILLETVGTVIRHQGVSSPTSDTMEEFTGNGNCLEGK